MIGSRLVLVYGFLPFFGVPQRAWQHVVALSGIRGGISSHWRCRCRRGLAFRNVIIDMVYGVVAFTVLTQGLMLAPVMRRLSLEPAGAAA